MFQHARGEMHDWLQRNERDNSDCGLGSPSRISPAKNCSAKMCWPSTPTVSRAAMPRCSAKNKTSVVHCPRSHDYFKHPPFERARLANAGVNICLGTDSLATVRKNGKQNPELDLFAEMRALADKDKSISPAEILELATVNGARALGLAGKAGELSPGAYADLIAVPFAGKIARVFETVLEHAGNVAASMIEGRWKILPK